MTSPSSTEQGAAGSGNSHPAEQNDVSSLVAVGRRLRQAREAQGLDTTVLAARLRIGVEQLESLESANRERLPEPVFVIAQARRVAAALHLDITPELQALRMSGELESLEQPEPQGSSREGQTSSPVPVKVKASPRRGSGGNASQAQRSPWRPPGRAILLGGGLLLSLAAAVWGVWRLQDASPVPTPKSAQVPAPPVRPVVRNVPRPVTPKVVVLTSREPSWVEVRRPDGTVLFSGMLQGAREFTLGKGIKVYAGRPDLVSSRIGSGPAQRLGAISDVRWRLLASGR